MPELLRTYRTTILRNIEVKELNAFLPDYIEDYSRKLKNSETHGNSWDKIADILNTNMEENPDGDREIDSVLFEKLIYDVQDHVYISALESEIDAEELISRFQGIPQLNRPVNATVDSNEHFISIRRSGNKALILYRYETIRLGNEDHKSNFYVPCVIDFENSLVQIRLRKHYLAKSSTKLSLLLNEVKEFINGLDADFSISNYNEAAIHSLLYQIFNEESQKAEIVIKGHMSDDLTEEQIDQKILTFLQNDLQMTEPELYSDRVKSAFYQDISLNLDPTLFYNGFIFAFTFLDREFIRSSTRNPKRDPIYNSKVYWNLKDLIHEYKEVSELSCYWKFNETDFSEPVGADFEFVEISLSEKYGSLEIHYYNNPSEKRRLKEDYVYYRISKYIFENPVSE